MLPALVAIQNPPALIAKDFNSRCGELSTAKDWPGLESFAREQITASPKDANAWAALGYALLAQDKSKEGRAACESSLTLDPKRTDALDYLGFEAASTGDTKSVLAVAKRIGERDLDSESRFLQIPAIQEAAIAPLRVPVAPGRIRFKSQALNKLLRASGRRDVPIVVAIVVDTEGAPISADALMAPSVEVARCAELDVMRWRVDPILIGGKPTIAKFSAAIRVSASAR